MLGAYRKRPVPLVPETFAQQPLGFQSVAEPVATPSLMQTPPAPKIGLKLGDRGDHRLGDLGALLLAYTGNPAGNGLMQQQRYDAQSSREQARYEAQANRPQIVNQGNGGYTVVNPADGSIISERAPTPEQGETERLIAMHATLPDDDPRKPLIERAIRGYQYTAPVMQAQTEAKVAAASGAAAARGAQARMTKATPSYANMHPKTGGGGSAKLPAGFILD